MGDARAFIDAVKQGDLAKVRTMLGADTTMASARSEKGYSAVSLAVYYGKQEILKALLAAGAVLDIGDAALVGDLRRVSELVKQDPSLVGKHSTDGFPPLGLAAYMGKKDIVEFLISNGADVNQIGKNEGRFTALSGAVANSHVDVVRVLLRSGADAKYRYEGGLSPLMEAAASGNGEIVKLLLAHGAEVAAKDERGRTAASLAEEKGHGEVAEFLRRNAADYH